MYAVHANVVRPESDDFSETGMAGKKGAVLNSSIAYPKYPGRTER